MYCLTYLLSAAMISLPAALASKGHLLPRGYFPSSYLDACDVNCTLTVREHIVCTVDCPPVIGVLGSGSAAYPPAPTRGVAPFANFSLPTATTTQYITTIPPYCLPGGPGAPVPNVPTVSIPEASLIATTPVPSLDIAPVVTPAIGSLIPAAILRPTGTVTANQTTSQLVQSSSQSVAVQPVIRPTGPSTNVSSQGTRTAGQIEKVVVGMLLAVLTAFISTVI